MKHIDITFDFETVSTLPDAAPMQLAAVVWDRSADGGHPFTGDEFNCGIDLRSCVMAGMSFDQETVKWWSGQNEAAKTAILENEGWPVETVFLQFCEWVRDMKAKHGAETVCLWCQGQDFDIPILKTIAHRFGLKMPVHQHWFRDARTVVLEGVMSYARITRSKVTAEDIIRNPRLAYRFIPEMPEEAITGRGVHDALYDCYRTSWNVWCVMRSVFAGAAANGDDGWDKLGRAGTDGTGCEGGYSGEAGYSGETGEAGYSGGTGEAGYSGETGETGEAADAGTAPNDGGGDAADGGCAAAKQRPA